MNKERIPLPDHRDSAFHIWGYFPATVVPAEGRVDYHWRPQLRVETMNPIGRNSVVPPTNRYKQRIPLTDYCMTQFPILGDVSMANLFFRFFLHVYIFMFTEFYRTQERRIQQIFVVFCQILL